MSRFKNVSLDELIVIRVILIYVTVHVVTFVHEFHAILLLLHL